MASEQGTPASAPPANRVETPREPLSALEREALRLQMAAREHTQQGQPEPDSPAYALLPASLRGTPLAASTPVWRIELHGPYADQPPLRLDIARDIVVGRRVGAENTVDVDLHPLGGYEFGVSRRHAMLRPAPDGLYVIDLKSTNGTLHNEVRLGPGVPRALHSNDVISFGGLACTLKIVGRLGSDGT